MRSQEEVKREQEEIAKHYKLSWWYYDRGRKCCGVYPKVKAEGSVAYSKVYLECEVCGSRTKGHDMPWQAWKEWDSMENEEINLFTMGL